MQLNRQKYNYFFVATNSGFLSANIQKRLAKELERDGNNDVVAPLQGKLNTLTCPQGFHSDIMFRKQNFQMQTTGWELSFEAGFTSGRIRRRDCKQTHLVENYKNKSLLWIQVPRREKTNLQLSKVVMSVRPQLLSRLLRRFCSSKIIGSRKPLLTVVTRCDLRAGGERLRWQSLKKFR